MVQIINLNRAIHNCHNDIKCNSHYHQRVICVPISNSFMIIMRIIVSPVALHPFIVISLTRTRTTLNRLYSWMKDQISNSQWELQTYKMWIAQACISRVLVRHWLIRQAWVLLHRNHRFLINDWIPKILKDKTSICKI